MKIIDFNISDVFYWNHGVFQVRDIVADGIKGCNNCAIYDHKTDDCMAFFPCLNYLQNRRKHVYFKLIKGRFLPVKQKTITHINQTI